MMLNHGRKSLPLLQLMAHALPTFSGPSLPTLWRISTVYHLWKEPSIQMIYSSGAAPDLPEEALPVHDGHGCFVRSPGSPSSSVRAWLFRSYGRLVSQKKYADGCRSCWSVTCGFDEVEAVENGGRAGTSFHTSCGGSNELILNRLKELGLGKNAIERFVLKHEGDPSFLSIGEKIELLLGGGFTVEQVTKLVSCKGSSNFVRASYERVEFLLKTLNKIKVSPGVVLTKHVRAFTSRNEKIGIGLGFLRGLGVDEDFVAAIAMKNPTLLFKSSEDLQKSVAVLQEIGMDTTSIRRVIQREPTILCLRIDKRIASKVPFWKSIGASRQDICRILCRSPTTLLRTSENLSPKVDFLKKLGFEPKTVVRAACCGVFKRTLKHLHAQYEFVQGQGFSHEEATLLLKADSKLMAYRQETLAKKIDYLVSVLGYDVKEILKCPIFLSSSLEKKIIPRCNALAERKKNGTLRRDYSLATIVTMPEKKFQIKFMQDMPREGYTDNSKEGGKNLHARHPIF